MKFRELNHVVEKCFLLFFRRLLKGRNGSLDSKWLVDDEFVRKRSPVVSPKDEIPKFPKRKSHQKPTKTKIDQELINLLKAQRADLEEL